MAEVNELPTGGNGQPDDSITRNNAPATSRGTGTGNATQIIVQLREPGSISMKVPLGQTPSSQNGNQPSSSRQQATGQGSQPSSSRQQATGQGSQPSGSRQQATGQGSQPSRNRQQTQVVAADEPPREKIYLSKESMAVVKEAVALGRLLPPDASRDE